MENKDVKVPDVLTPQQALNILIQGVQLAQQKGGVYTLNDAELISKAVKVFVDNKEPEKPAAQSEVKDDQSSDADGQELSASASEQK